MPSSHQRASRRPSWRWCIPVLLIGLLLYNPFLILVSHSDGLTYQAMARHRATVGASEMQHYSPVPERNAQPEVTVEEVFAVIVVAENTQSASPTFENEALPQRPELVGSVWFRPPPAA